LLKKFRQKVAQLLWSNLVDTDMANVIVSRDKWLNFYNSNYVFKRPNETNEKLLERYGVSRWDKVDLDNIRITFTNEKKMTYWILRWS
jgi:hypothetical protein